MCNVCSSVRTNISSNNLVEQHTRRMHTFELTVAGSAQALRRIFCPVIDET